MLIFVPLIIIAPPFLAFPVPTLEEELRAEVEIFPAFRVIELPLLALPIPAAENVLIVPVLIFPIVLREIPALLPLFPVIV